MDKHYLTSLLAPESIVVFAGRSGDAASQTTHAAGLHAALRAQRYAGKLYFLDIQTSGTLADLAQSRADLAIIAAPPDDIAAALELAGRMACRSALVLGSGIGPEKAAELKRVAQREGINLLGPNSLGFQRPSLQLNASVIGPLAKTGPLALVSQSGALTSSMLDWAAANAVGFSLVASVGRSTAVDIAQVLDFLAHDAQTQSIIVYLEGISSARHFMSALRSAAIAKPVVVLKSGRKPAGNEAAQTHSGAIVGSDEVFDAALRRAGAVRVRSFVELFSAAKCLASRYRPVGRRLAIVTNGGGPGVLAADWVSEIDLQLGKLSPESVNALRPLVPENASLSDLIDLSEEAGPEHYKAAIEAAGRDSGIDGVLAIHSPKARGDVEQVARTLVEIKHAMGKPLLTCMMGDASVGASRSILNDAAIPSFRTPEAAVGAFGNIASYYRNQLLLQQTPAPLSTLAKPDIEAARLIIESVLAERRKVLTEMESKALLSAFHIPVTKTILARNANEAMMIATQVGFPVALKIDSPDISHKSDVQGVALNILNGTGARDTYSDMVERVKRLHPEARINGVTVQKMADAAARARDLHRSRDRRPVRSDHRVRRRRHDDRAPERSRDGVAAAQPVPGAPPDRALPRRRDAGRMARRGRRRHGRARAGAAARFGNGVRAAAAARNGHQSDHRRRARRGGRRRAHRDRERAADHQRQFQQLQAPGHPALSGAPRTGVAAARRRPVHRAARSTRTTPRCCRTWCSTCRPRAATSGSCRQCPSCRRRCWRASR